MTTSPPGPGEERTPYPSRRFVFAVAVIMVLLAILLGAGLYESLTAPRKLCPPGNPDCGFLPPSAPATTPAP